jgi:hypothetical protein
LRYQPDSGHCEGGGAGSTESADFAKLVTWVSRSAVQPGADDFSMIWLLFGTFLPQVGGFVFVLLWLIRINR